MEKSNTSTTKIEYARAVAYEKLIDPFLEKVRHLISEFIPRNNTVIDIGCGTGALALHLARDKNCTVLGIDLASGKIARANDRKANAHLPKVQFIEADATCLEWISDKKFDVAIMSLFLHSLPKNLRSQIIKEAIRIAQRIVIADYVTNQPASFSGFAVKGIEWLAGGEHFQSFNQFKASGGLEPLLKEAGLVIIKEQLNPSRTVRIVIVEKEHAK